MAENLITSISISVKADTKDAEAKLNSLTGAIKNLDAAASSGLSPNLTASLERLGEIAKGLDGFKRIAIKPATIDGIKDLTISLINLTHGVDVDKLKDIALSLRSFAFAEVVSNGTFAKMAEGLSGIAHQMEARNLADVAKEARRARKELLREAEAQRKAAEEAAANNTVLGRLKTKLKSITKSVNGFLSSLKRIAMYRLIRSVLKSITQGFREGIQNMYQYSTLIDGQFKKSMDRLSTSALYLKNSLGALVAPIINALAPAIDMLVDKFVDLLNFINKTIATLTGAATWTKALKYPKEYADALDGASGSAKELRATLLGFDEINRLDDHTKGARGAASDMMDYSKMFEEVDTGEISDLWDGIFKVGKSKFGIFAGSAATLFALKMGGAFDGLFGSTASTGILGKFTAVLLAAFGGFTLGNWLYEHVPGIRNWTDQLMEKWGPKIDGVVNWIGEKFSKIDIGLGLELLAEEIVGFENSVKEGWDIIGESAGGFFDKVHNWMIEWGYALMDFHDIRINFHTSVDSTEWDLFQKKVSGELDKINDQIKSAHQNAYDFQPTGTGTIPPYATPNADAYRKVDDTSNQKKTGAISSITAAIKNAANLLDQKVKDSSILYKAGGGDVPTGDLFIANENGPELIAQVGNRTQVANNDQITKAIEVATANGNAESNVLLRQVVDTLGQILRKDNTVVANITTDSITNGLDRQNRRSGRTVVPIGG